MRKVLFIVLLLLAGCASKGPKKAAESIPLIHLMPNESGIVIWNVNSHGPKNLIGAIGEPPDVPSGITAAIERDSQTLAKLGNIQVVSIENPSLYRLSEIIGRWKNLIEDEKLNGTDVESILFTQQLSEIPWANAGRGFPAKFRRCQFPWGKAALFLTTGYAQGKTGEVVNNERLKLVLQGLTSDGRYAVHGYFTIGHPKLPESAEDKKLKGKVIYDFDDENKRAAKWLETQQDDSFLPTLSQYNNFLKALRIDSPEK